MIKKKSILIILLLFIALCLGVIAVCFLRFHGSIAISVAKDTENIIPCENVILFRQDDEKWAEDKLGNSVYSMKKSGCFVTCIAAALSMEGMNVSPKSLNELFSSEGVYDREGNLQWDPLRQLDDGETYEVEVFTSVTEEILRDCLLKGKFPIVRVRMNSIGNYHYVLVVKLEDGQYFCMDPLKEQLQPLSHYGNRVYAVRCVSKKNED